ncbi:GNAT family N-acetyltransferase [Roseateles sp.]|uniref:GNAT family N-acetyltransferase n=1 Tax=Roseateles sp. TaxID=1971397 RepID=UPI003D13FCAA
MPRLANARSALPVLGAMPLRMAFVAANSEARPMNFHSLGSSQIWVARAGDPPPRAAIRSPVAGLQGLSLQRERVDQPQLRALLEQFEAERHQLCPASRAACAPELEVLRGPQTRLLVLRDAQERVLACGGLLLHDEYAEVLTLMVLPGWRGRGVGEMLLQALQREALRAGQPLLRLQVGVQQRSAQRLFERLGFARCGPFGAHRADPFALFMEKLAGD